MQTSDPIGFVDKEAAVPAPLAIEAHGLSLTFETSDGKVEALSNVDLQIEAGDFVSFIGPSGCGKTTLLRIVADLERPTEGTILVNGVTPEQARLKRHYGYIFQAPALYPWRTIERNVMLPLEVMGVAWEERRARGALSAARQPVGLRAQVSVAAFGRHATAGLDRPGAVVRPRAAADG